VGVVGDDAGSGADELTGDEVSLAEVSRGQSRCATPATAAENILEQICQKNKPPKVELPVGTADAGFAIARRP